MFAVEGILRSNELRNPSEDGTRLYHALKGLYKLVLVTNSNSDEIERWLKIHGYKEHFNVYYGTATDEVDLRIEQLSKIREDGEHVDLAVDSNPSVAEKLFKNNITCLLYMSPTFAAPEFRPDYDAEVKPWEAINEEMARQYETRNRWQEAYNKEIDK